MVSCKNLWEKFVAFLKGKTHLAAGQADGAARCRTCNQPLRKDNPAVCVKGHAQETRDSSVQAAAEAVSQIRGGNRSAGQVIDVGPVGRGQGFTGQLQQVVGEMSVVSCGRETDVVRLLGRVSLVHDGAGGTRAEYALGTIGKALQGGGVVLLEDPGLLPEEGQKAMAEVMQKREITTPKGPVSVSPQAVLILRGEPSRALGELAGKGGDQVASPRSTVVQRPVRASIAAAGDTRVAAEPVSGRPRCVQCLRPLRADGTCPLGHSQGGHAGAEQGDPLG